MRLMLLCLCFFGSLLLSAQEGRAREIGVRLPGLDDFNLLYKKSLSVDSYRRYRFFSGNLSFNNMSGVSVGNLSAGAAIGKETRSALADKLQFIQGPEFFGSLSLLGTDNTFQFVVTPGFGYVLGLQYDVSERLYIGLETIPSVSISYGNGASQIISLNAGFASSAVALTAMYRFYK